MKFPLKSLMKSGPLVKFGYGRKVITNYCVIVSGVKSMKRKRIDTASSSESSRISTLGMEKILNKLKANSTRKSTAESYLRIWRQFNKFVIKLDVKPASWEDRTSLFVASLVDSGAQSCSIKTYVSAIKKTLTDDGYGWDDKKIMLTTLTKACKLVNDRVKIRLPIQSGLLDLILYEVKRMFGCKQPYLETLYLAMFAMGYYGLLRAGEMTLSEHVIKAANVHISKNKDKLLIILYSSKTHSRANVPQKIKISANSQNSQNQKRKRNFCPFNLIRNYLAIRGEYADENEPFFIFRGKEPVKACNLRSVLKDILKLLGLDNTLYNIHSLRIGRSTEMYFRLGYTLQEVKTAGRWRSGAVFRYLR